MLLNGVRSRRGLLPKSNRSYQRNQSLNCQIWTDHLWSSQMLQMRLWELVYSKEYDGIKHPVMYASKKLLPREQNYSVGEREALAIIWAANKFHRFYGQHFVIECDHRPLEYLQTTHSKNPRLFALEFGSATIPLYGRLY